MRTAEVASTSATGAVTGLTVGTGACLVAFRRPGTGATGDVAVAAVPDHAAAARVSAALRRIAWVAVDVTGPVVSCSVAGISRRPRSVVVPTGAALALIEDGVPAVVRTAGGPR